ncbi:MAG: peroxiredoxin [Gammaproteobacteria bacterium]|nr:peroxiredoxin [Gammaproteobacteria bacterium]
MAIEEGKKPPMFTLPNQSGKKIALRELIGKDVILFFYPKDHTPGCTKEASGFQALLPDIRKARRGVVVLGVSMDDADSHKKFRKDYGLRFDLLTDANHKVMEKYEAYGEKMMYGKTRIGVIRSTVWIGKDGKVAKHWRRVPKAADHPQKVLEALSA